MQRPIAHLVKEENNINWEENNKGIATTHVTGSILSSRSIFPGVNSHKILRAWGYFCEILPLNYGPEP